MMTSEDINRLNDENKKLKKRVEEAEGENTIIKGIGLNSPEMKALRKKNEELKAELAREKEDHQYDNLVHENELKSLESKKHRMNQK
tara:strand:+ start:162 stop:422 length:261 start_codon:yes stop_codon:yes gene_type:complete